MFFVFLSVDIHATPNLKHEHSYQSQERVYCSPFGLFMVKTERCSAQHVPDQILLVDIWGLVHIVIPPQHRLDSVAARFHGHSQV